MPHASKELTYKKLDRSGVILWYQVAAWVPDMFCNFYFWKITNLLITQELDWSLRKDMNRFGIIRILVRFTKFKNNPILFNKIGNIFIEITTLFLGDAYWGCIFSHVQPFYEWAVGDLDSKRYMHRPVKVAHSSFIEGSHTTKNTASGYIRV